METRLRFAGHLQRMAPDRIPHCMVTCKMQHKRPTGGARASWAALLNGDLKRIGFTANSYGAVDGTEWRTAAMDRNSWRRRLKDGAESYNVELVQNAKNERAARKAGQTTKMTKKFTCPICQRGIAHKSGLERHLAKHDREDNDTPPEFKCSCGRAFHTAPARRTHQRHTSGHTDAN